MVKAGNQNEPDGFWALVGLFISRWQLRQAQSCGSASSWGFEGIHKQARSPPLYLRKVLARGLNGLERDSPDQRLKVQLWLDLDTWKVLHQALVSSLGHTKDVLRAAIKCTVHSQGKFVRQHQVVTGKSIARSWVRRGTWGPWSILFQGSIHSSGSSTSRRLIARSHGCRPPFSALCIKRSCCMCSQQTATECLHPWLQRCGAATWIKCAAGTVRFSPWVWVWFHVLGFLPIRADKDKLLVFLRLWASMKWNQHWLATGSSWSQGQKFARGKVWREHWKVCLSGWICQGWWWAGSLTTEAEAGFFAKKVKMLQGT